MNTESPPTTTEPTPAAKQESPTLATAYRGNGKIARLPRPIRDQINHWLADGFSYPDIIKRLGDHGKGLKPDHLCEWKKRGYKDWLAEQDKTARETAEREDRRR